MPSTSESESWMTRTGTASRLCSAFIVGPSWRTGLYVVKPLYLEQKFVSMRYPRLRPSGEASNLLSMTRTRAASISVFAATRVLAR